MPTGVYIRTKETRERMSKSAMGNQNGLGYVHSKKSIRKVIESRYNNGKSWHSEETKQKMRKPRSEKAKQNMRGHKYPKSKETRRKMSESHIGLYPSEETRHKMSGSRPHTQGKKSHLWRGGISNLPYPFDFNEKLKELIRQRDNYICQLCGKTEKEEVRNLSVHHIDYNKENCNPKNLITLCQSCNAKVNRGRIHWSKFFQSKLRIHKRNVS